MGTSSSKQPAVRVLIKEGGETEDGKTCKAGDEARLIGPAGDRKVLVLLDDGMSCNVLRAKIEIVSEDLSVGMRVKSKANSADDGKWYKEGDEGKVLGPSKMGPERVEVEFDSKPKKPQQPPRLRLEIQSPLRFPGKGMKTIILIRHGQAEHNLHHPMKGNQFPDAKLTKEDGLPSGVGEGQAKAWANNFGSFADIVGKVELILVSPLQRTIQTACYVFADTSAPMLLCLPAREVYRKKQCDIPLAVYKPDELQKLLEELPEGSKARIDANTMIRAQDGMEEAAEPDIDGSVRQLRYILATREENTIAVVTHGGLIERLTGEKADNCTMLECVLFYSDDSQEPQLVCVQKHATPYVPPPHVPTKGSGCALQ
jgi:broad specificity phosphatase PhoE